ncbi:MAG: hypothetical protein OXE99_04700, partial [Cellvibrionales bacterium]|nr:hypothetical protein [Cellvibrionales bacterium]
YNQQCAQQLSPYSTLTQPPTSSRYFEIPTNFLDDLSNVGDLLHKMHIGNSITNTFQLGDSELNQAIKDGKNAASSLSKETLINEIKASGYAACFEDEQGTRDTIIQSQLDEKDTTDIEKILLKNIERQIALYATVKNH